MSASILLGKLPEGEKYTQEEIITLLNNNGLSQGIDKELIQQIIDDKMFYKDYCCGKWKKFSRW